MSNNVLLVIHAPTVPIVSERRLPADVSLTIVKGRLELLCGIPPEAQSLSLWTARTDDRSSGASLVGRLNDVQNDQTLSQFGAKDGMGLLLDDRRDSHERDQFGAKEEERVQKYEMDDEAYAQRTDTVLAYKQRMKMGRFGDAKSTTASTSVDLPQSIKPGVRCQVEGGRRGTIRYAGPTEFAAGAWVGVEYDEPVGKNDGSVAGKRYFSCTPKYGGFAKPDKLVVGDFPVRSIEDELDDDDDEEM